MNIDYKLIGQRIKNFRKKNNLTQEALAEKLNVSVGYISQVERGVTRISLDLLALVSTQLNCDISELIIYTAKSSQNYLVDPIYDKISNLDAKERQLILDLIDVVVKNKINS